MITKTRETYQCEHCRKIYIRKGFCERHEAGKTILETVFNIKRQSDIKQTSLF